MTEKPAVCARGYLILSSGRDTAWDKKFKRLLGKQINAIEYSICYLDLAYYHPNRL